VSHLLGHNLGGDLAYYLSHKLGA